MKIKEKCLMAMVDTWVTHIFIDVNSEEKIGA